MTGMRTSILTLLILLAPVQQKVPGSLEESNLQFSGFISTRIFFAHRSVNNVALAQEVEDVEDEEDEEEGDEEEEEGGANTNTKGLNVSKGKEINIAEVAEQYREQLQSSRQSKMTKKQKKELRKAQIRSAKLLGLAQANLGDQEGILREEMKRVAEEKQFTQVGDRFVYAKTDNVTVTLEFEGTESSILKAILNRIVGKPRLISLKVRTDEKVKTRKSVEKAASRFISDADIELEKDILRLSFYDSTHRLDIVNSVVGFVLNLLIPMIVMARFFGPILSFLLSFMSLRRWFVRLSIETFSVEIFSVFFFRAPLIVFGLTALDNAGFKSEVALNVAIFGSAMLVPLAVFCILSGHGLVMLDAMRIQSGEDRKGNSPLIYFSSQIAALAVTAFITEKPQRPQLVCSGDMCISIYLTTKVGYCVFCLIASEVLRMFLASQMRDPVSTYMSMAMRKQSGGMDIDVDLTVGGVAVAVREQIASLVYKAQSVFSVRAEVGTTGRTDMWVKLVILGEYNARQTGTPSKAKAAAMREQVEFWFGKNVKTTHYVNAAIELVVRKAVAYRVYELSLSSLNFSWAFARTFSHAGALLYTGGVTNRDVIRGQANNPITQMSPNYALLTNMIFRPLLRTPINANNLYDDQIIDAVHSIVSAEPGLAMRNVYKKLCPPGHKLDFSIHVHMILVADAVCMMEAGGAGAGTISNITFHGEVVELAGDLVVADRAPTLAADLTAFNGKPVPAAGNAITPGTDRQKSDFNASNFVTQLNDHGFQTDVQLINFTKGGVGHHTPQNPAGLGGVDQKLPKFNASPLEERRKKVLVPLPMISRLVEVQSGGSNPMAVAFVGALRVGGSSTDFGNFVGNPAAFNFDKRKVCDITHMLKQAGLTTPVPPLATNQAVI